MHIIVNKYENIASNGRPTLRTKKTIRCGRPWKKGQNQKQNKVKPNTLMVFAFVLILFGFYWIDKITTARRVLESSSLRSPNLFTLQLPIWYSDCNLCAPPAHTHTHTHLHTYTFTYALAQAAYMWVASLWFFPPLRPTSIEALCLNICNMLRVPGSWKHGKGRNVSGSDCSRSSNDSMEFSVGLGTPLGWDCWGVRVCSPDLQLWISVSCSRDSNRLALIT